MWHDWRYILLYLIFIISTAYILYRNNPNRGRWYSSGTFEDFNFIEAGITLVLFFLISAGLWTWGRNMRINNFNEQIGGFIIDKYYKDGSHEVRHENCTGSGDDRTCTSWYETVYHRDFYVLNNIGDWFSGSTWSNRIDTSCSGCEPYQVPDYYQQAYVGKPVSLENSYPNYIAAMNEKLYENTYLGLTSYLKDICPVDFYQRVSYDSAKKAFAIGFEPTAPIVSEVDSWNFAPNIFTSSKFIKEDRTIHDIPLYMDTMFGYLGDEVQGDTYVYVVNSTFVEYGQLCMAKWKNGAKNGIYIFIFGTYDNQTYKPTDVYVAMGVDGTTKNSELKFMNESERSNYYVKYDIRNDLLNYFDTGLGFNKDRVLSIVFENVYNKFVRQEMSNFKDLIIYVYPTDGFLMLMAFLMSVFQICSIFYFANNGE